MDNLDNCNYCSEPLLPERVAFQGTGKEFYYCNNECMAACDKEMTDWQKEIEEEYANN